MSQVNVTINGRQFRMACEDGQEGHLQQLAKDLDDRIVALRGQFGEIGDARLTVMAALTVCDELLDANAKWYRHTIEQFGPGRCMFESNFPVDRLSCSYSVLWNQFKKLTKGFSADERTAMFHDTAMRTYRLARH